MGSGAAGVRCRVQGGEASSGAASLVDASKALQDGTECLWDARQASYSLEFKGGGVFYFKTIIDNLDDNS